MASDVRAAIAHAARHEAPRALATLTRVLGDVGAAEDAVQDALAIALRVWPERGVPDEPAAWLTTTARNRARDGWRRESRRLDKEVTAVRDRPPEPEVVLHPVADDQLRLLFTCAHPAIGPDAQLALMLRLVCGLRTDQIARSCLVPVATVSQRLVRAKRKIRDARVPFRVPDADQLPARLPVVLAAIEQVFTRGYAPVTGGEVVDVHLCDEGRRLARLLVELRPDEPEALGLLALVTLQDSRRATRADTEGRLVPLSDQDRSRWDRDAIAEGLTALDRAVSLGRPGPYQLQAIVASEHARAPSFAATRWDRIVAAYDALLAATGSPVVALNRAVAVSYGDGAAAALPLLDRLLDDRSLATSHRLAAARADVLERLGDAAGAVAAYDTAILAAPAGPERAHLEERRRRLGGR
ncbi:sigma-70 family RNA polymerase sigma factor [Nitriliruptoraceae bacterium ZYF776]|nr:sigma-70 family RNA polymerase sigma factor [Profundirhabdus halotolerans]